MGSFQNAQRALTEESLEEQQNIVYGRLAPLRAEDMLPVADYFSLPELRKLLEKQHEKKTEKEGKLVSCIEESVEDMGFCSMLSARSPKTSRLEDFIIEVGGFLFISFLVANRICNRCPPWLLAWMISGG